MTSCASDRTPEQSRELAERVRQHFQEQRAHGEPLVGPSPEETLAEESDQNAGRTVRFDLRVTPVEKAAWAQ